MIPVEWTRGPDAAMCEVTVGVHELFEEQARRTPRATAVEAHDGDLAYGELDTRADRLARVLRSAGVGPDSVVGVFLGQSADRLVALLGIWKAGGAALLLDPSYPSERTAFVLADSGCRLLLAHSVDRLRVPSFQGHTVYLDTDSSETPTAGTVSAAAGPADLAFVTYTSGSTGRPKGVAIEHRSLVAHADAMRRVFADGRPGPERVLQVCPFGFDMFLLEVGVALFHGGTLCLPAPGIILMGPDLARELRDRRITFAVFAPSTLLHQRVEEFPDLATIVCAGEPLPERVVEEWAPGRRLFNGYGPGETTVLSTVSACRPGGGVPTIGRPVAHNVVHILDEERRPVPPGVPGEIHIGGAGVARGYLGHPELTAARFLPDPHSAEPGARMYRTGDRARWTPDGAIEFLGRLDNQVKINGFRIEPEEIEAVLGAHPRVRSCAVTVDEDKSGVRQLVAHVVTADDTSVAWDELRRHLRESLPYYMVPQLFLGRSKLPLSPNGKIDRSALTATGVTPIPLPERAGASEAALHEALREIWASLLDTDEFGLDDGFFDAGGNSLLMVRLRTRVNEQLGTVVSITELFEHTTIRDLARHLRSSANPPTAAAAPTIAARESRSGVPSPSAALSTTDSAAPPQDAVAVIGMAGRFPGAADTAELWDLLRSGGEGIVRGRNSRPDHVEAAGLISTDFDTTFFRYTPADVRGIDPQQHLFLETAWAALEHAGHAPGDHPGGVGVFGGSGFPHHWLRRMDREEDRVSLDRQSALTGNPLQFLAPHVAHKLSLHGPAVTVNTACSTSLVAVHLACKDLISGQCAMALAGGVSLLPPGSSGYALEDSGPFSQNGYCRPFDAAADGTVPAAGAGVVVLKLLAAALADGDHVHAVIRGSAVNNDGSRKAGFATPSVEGQREVLTQAYAAAGVDMDSVGYIQAHGTGTPVGDPIEVQALTRAFRQDTARTGFCALGSVKGNLGHLDSAAGVCGLITAVLALEHREIPGTAHFDRANPELGLEESPFYVNSTTVPWPDSGDEPRRAGVSSFGLGGTNAHVVLEQAPLVPEADHGPARPDHLLVTSARDPQALADVNAALAEALRSGSPAFADVAFTLQQGRAALRHRRAVVSADSGGAANALEDVDHPDTVHGTCADTPPPVAFVFPGGATQYPDMGKELYTREPAYRDAIDRCAALFDAELDTDLRSLLFPAASDRERADVELRRVSRNLAAVAATEYATATLLRAWGIRPTVVFGHSLGEYVGAVVSGVLDLPGMVRLVGARGRLCDGLPPAAMLTVQLPEVELVPLLNEDLSLAAVNSPRHCVVSGPAQAVEEFAHRLSENGTNARLLPVAGGTHSVLVEPIMDELEKVAATIEHHPPRVPMISGLTGTPLGADEIGDGRYWPRHLRGTAHVADGLDNLLTDPNLIVVEVGPGQTLTRLTLLHPRSGEDRLVCPTLSPEQGTDDRRSLLKTLGKLWCRGVEIDWDALWAGRTGRRTPLPTYPFRRGGAPTAPPPTSTAEPIGRGRAASDDLEEILAEVWKELLGVPQVAPEDDFFTIGGDSLLAIRFRTRLQRRLDTAVASHALLEHPTFGALLDHLRSLRPTPADITRSRIPLTTDRRVGTNPLLLTIREGHDSHLPIALVQAIGGTAYAYRELARYLDPNRPVWAFRAHGLEPDEDILDTIEAIAARNVQELLQRRPHGPYILGGHSSGGLIAQEMARQITVRGGEVSLVVMIDTPSMADLRRLDLHRVDDILRVFDTFRYTAPNTWRAFDTAMRTDPLVRRIVVTTNQAILTHAPAPCRSNVLFLRAHDPEDYLEPHPEAAWAELFDGTITVRTVPGNHMTMMEPPRVETTARALREHLDPMDRHSAAPLATTVDGPGHLSVRSPSDLVVEGLTLDDAVHVLRHYGGIHPTEPRHHGRGTE